MARIYSAFVLSIVTTLALAASAVFHRAGDTSSFWALRRASTSRRNEPFLYKDRGTPAEYGAGIKLAMWVTEGGEGPGACRPESSRAGPSCAQAP
jgi:hypothetical protein